jgi:uncharacterized RDD family membrane protein YckC
MDWFYVENQRQVGPVSEAEFARLVGAGTIRRETLVWRAGMKEWQPYGSLLPPTPPAPPAGAMPGAGSGPTSGGGAAPDAVPGATFSAPSAPMSPVRPVTAVRYAGFWIRFLARIVDGLILGLVNFVLLLPLGISSFGFLTGTPDLTDIASFVGLILLSTSIRVAIAGAYEIMLTTMKGATLGKMALGLKVVRPDGSGISAGRSTGRFFGTWLSGFILCIGYIIAAFDDEKRSLHDRLCDTRVIRT